ncbi:MAG TPA: dihydroneopterin aldolase, partial [Gaiella sp.]|nr:dihydroneopterin aldolase [Gaiella sp.]
MTIELRAIELFGFHGVLEHERREGQRFLVDVELDYQDEAAAASDRIEDAMDYREVVAAVVEVSDGRAYHLLEAFATELANQLTARFPVARVRVRVRKPD